MSGPTGRAPEDDGWDELFDGLARRGQALIDAGWTLTSTERERAEFGDTVFWDLERDGITIELELYEHGQLVAYPTGERSEEDEVAEPYFSIYGSTVASSREAFRAAGWL